MQMFTAYAIRIDQNRDILLIQKTECIFPCVCPKRGDIFNGLFSFYNRI